MTDRHESVNAAGDAAREEGESPLPPYARGYTLEDVLLHCLSIFTRQEDIVVTVNLFLESVGGYYQADRAYLVEIDHNQQRMSATYEWCRPGVCPQIENTRDLDVSMVSNWISEFERGKEVYIRSIDSELDHASAMYQLLISQDIQCLMFAPLRHGGELIGFLGVDNPGAQSEHLEVLSCVAEFILLQLEKRRLTSELQTLGSTDTLTGQMNRYQFSHDLQQYDRNPPNAIGVVSVDINGLKNLNIIYGHEYGDYVLKRVGAIMREQLGDVVYRVSGDEFVGLCVNGSRDVFQERIIALRQAFAANRECDVSMGCAWSFGQVDAKAQYQQADENRELEKQSYYLCALNKGQTNVRAEGFTAEVLREVSGGSFIVHYQPQLELKTGKLVGVEALVRKVDDNGCLISPDKFISFYEVSGVISHVDLFVLRKACAAVRHWQEKGLSLNVSVNFSRMTLMLPNIVGTISKICDEAEISPSCITIEVTESVSKIAHEQLKMLIKRLKSVGFSISLDDFGSEYSNLAILSAIKFDEVKFDKTLVSTLEHNRHSRVVMENSINMCRGLDRTRSLAEGIETRGQLDLLLAYQCDYGQGNYFSRPLPLVELDAYIRNLEEGTRPL